MTRKSKGLEALFGVAPRILFCTHLEPSRWWPRDGAGRGNARAGRRTCGDL